MCNKIKTMKIAIASDHGGFALKEEIKLLLKELDCEAIDYGTHSLDSVDYPDYALAVAGAVAEAKCERGILVCGTGQGMAMAANKVPGIRAAVVHDTFSAHATREHNDSNVLTMGGRVIGAGLAMDIVRIWLETKFQGGRHEQRVQKIVQIEQGSV